MRIQNKIWPVVIMILIGSNVFCQDLSNIHKAKPFDWNSSLSIGSNFFHTTSGTPTSSPFGYYINANASMSIYGLSIPLSFSYRNQQFNYSKPYFRLGISPHYKWARLYVGQNSIYFSPYTLAGVTFNGIGLAITPGKFRLTMMAGNLLNPKAILDSIQGKPSYINPYNRTALGMKIGVGSSSKNVDLIIFKGKDKSRIKEIPDSILIKPVENLIVGLQSKLSFFENKIQFQINGAGSLFTNSQLADPLEVGTEEEKYYKLGNKFTTINSSTRLNLAGDATLDFNFDHFSIGGKYQYIDPVYTSLGAFYFQDDNENYTLRASTAFWKGRIALDGSYGWQQNNVRNHRSLASVQKIYDLSTNWSLANWFGFSGQYSNFNFNQESGLIIINDSLRYGQITASSSFNPYFTFAGKTLRHNITISYTEQNIKELSLDQGLPQRAQITSGNLNYSVNNKSKAYTINTSLQYLKSLYSESLTQRYGVYLSCQKSFNKSTIQTRLQINYAKNYLENEADGNQYGMNTGFSFKIAKKYNFGMNLNYVNRSALIGRSYAEWRGNTSLNIQLK